MYRPRNDDDITEQIPIVRMAGREDEPAQATPAPTRWRRRPRPGRRVPWRARPARPPAPRWVAISFGVACFLIALLAFTDLGIVLTKNATSGPAPTASSSARGGAGLPSKSFGALTGPNPAATRHQHRHHHLGRQHRRHHAHRLRVVLRHHHRAQHAPPTTPASGPGAPRLTGVTPGSAGGGATVVVHGSNLVSSNGVVLARVDGQATYTDCTTRTSCDVRIPDLGGAPKTVPITITTSGGTSNSVDFRYR